MIFSWEPDWGGLERPAGRMAKPGNPNRSEENESERPQGLYEELYDEKEVRRE